jgi:hypothetical protein
MISKSKEIYVLFFSPMAQTKIYVLLGNKRDLNGLFGPNKRTGHRDDEGSLTNRPQKRRGPLKNIKISALDRRSAVRRHPICRRERQPLQSNSSTARRRSICPPTMGKPAKGRRQNAPPLAPAAIARG